MNTHQHKNAKNVIQKTDLISLEDGFWYVFFKNTGAVSAEELRILADYLDELNAALKNDIEKYFKKKKRVKIYIAGPMTGHYQYNFFAFDFAKDTLEYLGYEVVSPADMNRADGMDVEALARDGQDWNKAPEGFTTKHFVRKDLNALMECDAIYMLPGWETSKGATAEYHVAKWLGLDIRGKTT